MAHLQGPPRDAASHSLLHFTVVHWQLEKTETQSEDIVLYVLVSSKPKVVNMFLPWACSPLPELFLSTSSFPSLQQSQSIWQHCWIGLHFCEPPIRLPTFSPWDTLSPALGHWPSLPQTLFPALGTTLRLQNSNSSSVLTSLTDFNWVYKCTWRPLRLVFSKGEREEKAGCVIFPQETNPLWQTHES